MLSTDTPLIKEARIHITFFCLFLFVFICDRLFSIHSVVIIFTFFLPNFIYLKGPLDERLVSSLNSALDIDAEIKLSLSFSPPNTLEAISSCLKTLV